MLIQQVRVRPAQAHDVPAIASLVVEGFGHEYGGVLRQPAGIRAMERIYQLPGRLQGVVVAVDPDDHIIGMAGLRTSEMRSDMDYHEQVAMHRELGMALMLQLELWSVFVDPLPYQVKRHEALVYSVTVAERWRGRGVADALMDAVHTLAQQRGKSTMVLEVVENNHAARRLYARQGYTVRHRRRGLLAWLPFLRTTRLLLEKELV